MVIALNGKIVRYQKQVGLQGYEGLPFGTYLIRINEKTFKIQLSISRYPYSCLSYLLITDMQYS